MQLGSDPRSLRQILNSHFFFIPRFQRDYSWTKENVEELWEDAIQESSGDYFIGSMVVYPQAKKKDTFCQRSLKFPKGDHRNSPPPATAVRSCVSFSRCPRIR